MKMLHAVNVFIITVMCAHYDVHMYYIAIVLLFVCATAHTRYICVCYSTHMLHTYSCSDVFCAYDWCTVAMTLQCCGLLVVHSHVSFMRINHIHVDPYFPYIKRYWWFKLLHTIYSGSDLIRDTNACHNHAANAGTADTCSRRRRHGSERGDAEEYEGSRSHHPG